VAKATTGIFLDAAYPEHPKVVGLTDEAFNMEIRAMCYTARNHLDGFVPTGCLRSLTVSSSPRDVAAELVTAGRWHRADVPCPQGHDDTCPTMAGEGWRIHDYLDDNKSSAELSSRRQAGATRMARSRARARGAAADVTAPAAADGTPEDGHRAGHPPPPAVSLRPVPEHQRDARSQ
jgi:hypothetical protein